MTHILKADKEHYRFFDLKDLADDSKVRIKNNVPVRVLAKVFCFLTRDGMYKISRIARDDGLVRNFTVKRDLQMDSNFIFEKDPIGQQLKLSLITRDDYYMFMDCSELHKDANLFINKQCFFSGNILIIEHDIACLKLNCVTPAEELDIDLYTKTRLLMDHILKPKPLEARNQAAATEEKSSAIANELDEKPTDVVDLENRDNVAVNEVLEV